VFWGGIQGVIRLQLPRLQPLVFADSPEMVETPDLQRLYLSKLVKLVANSIELHLLKLFDMSNLEDLHICKNILAIAPVFPPVYPKNSLIPFP
jgi:hypothetical protein